MYWGWGLRLKNDATLSDWKGTCSGLSHPYGAYAVSLNPPRLLIEQGTQGPVGLG